MDAAADSGLVLVASVWSPASAIRWSALAIEGAAEDSVAFAGSWPECDAGRLRQPGELSRAITARSKKKKAAGDEMGVDRQGAPWEPE